MWKYLYTPLLLLLLILPGCAGNDFKLEFSLPKDVSAHYRVAYYASDKKGGMNVESVANVQEGKGVLKGGSRNPVILYLYGGGPVPAVIYVKKGETLKITGPDRNPASWTVEGNDINRDLSLWRNAHATTLAGGTQEEVNEAVADFVKENPDNPASTLLLLTAYSRRMDETGFRTLWSSLGADAEKERFTEMAGRADLPVSRVPLPGRLTSMALRSLGNGVDTIRPASAGATLLYFWNNGMDRRKDYIDSLKVLVKEFPDSATRMIADISLDPDSVTWRSPLRGDSLKTVARLWVPAGLADTRLMDLGVTASPFFIVFSRDGHQRYRGREIGEAMLTFRELLSKQPAAEAEKESANKKEGE